jgi:hypothetical protein
MLIPSPVGSLWEICDVRIAINTTRYSCFVDSTDHMKVSIQNAIALLRKTN